MDQQRVWGSLPYTLSKPEAGVYFHNNKKITPRLINIHSPHLEERSNGLYYWDY
jgi:hypothetical protein